jgi:glycosyltransferase involved in cell wall biosynthesis
LKNDIGNTFPLVIGGGKGWLLDHFESEIRQLGLAEEVILLGYVDDKSLQWLYRNCFAFIFPSFFEGFGLPVLEAMSQGAAVITSNVTSIPEVVGDAGIMVDPRDIDSLTVRMKDILTGNVNRGGLKKKAFQRSKEFSWDKVAEKVLITYNKIVSLT